MDWTFPVPGENDWEGNQMYDLVFIIVNIEPDIIVFSVMMFGLRFVR